MNGVFRVLSWLAFLCGVITYFIAWGTLLVGSAVWGIAAEFWFYDAISAVLIGIFLLLVVRKQ